MDIILRRASWNDVDILYRWANDPSVRENSFCSDMIPYETHIRWFHALLNDPEQRQYILLADGEMVGQLRLSWESETVKIGYSIAREHRGRGFGKKLLTLAVEQARKDFPKAKTITGKVKPMNIASKKAFVAAGFLEIYEEFSSNL